MEFSGRYLIPASAEAVWAGLNDPDVLKSCIPGCERMEKTDPTHFLAAVTLKIGPMKATFKGNVALENLNAPHSATLTGEGQGGVAGFAKGQAEITLTPEDGGTLLAYTAKANIGGKLAQIGQRLIDGAARQIADDFFSRFSAAVSANTVGSAGPKSEVVLDEIAPSVELPPVEPQPGSVITPSGKREGVAPEIWVVGLIAVIVILLVLFGLVLPGA